MSNELVKAIIHSEATINPGICREFWLFDRLPVMVEGVADLQLTPYRIGNGDLDIIIGGGSTSKIRNDIYSHDEAFFLSEYGEPFALLTKGFARIKEGGKKLLRFTLFNPDPKEVRQVYKDHSKTELVENNSYGGGGQGLEDLWSVVSAHENTDKHGYLIISKRATGNFLITPVTDQALPPGPTMSAGLAKTLGGI